jgi:hypothetical protein
MIKDEKYTFGEKLQNIFEEPVLDGFPINSKILNMALSFTKNLRKGRN